MGSTLEHGIYLPSEGEKNCYQGLAGNWNKVDGALGDIAELKQSIESKFTKEIVTELPTEDINPFCIYMILKTDPETDNIYDEWVYINNSWEYLGNTKVDMTQYYTKQEVNQLPAVASGVTATKVGNYDTHLADSNIHVTSADKTKWNTVALIKQLRLVNAQVGSATTIAFANIDDTNGIKVGDKCMDLDAKMFEITAVDTTNQTVTVGSALIDLAQDSDVVHKSGDETISGVKTITDTNLEFKSTSAEYGVSAGDSSVIFRDKNNLQTFKIYSRVFYSGVDNNLVSFFLTQKVDNTYYASNGIQLLANTDNKNVILRPIPANNNADGLSVSLGDSNRRWQSIYANNYYYGSDNVEFSTKFVTTDTNQTISGNKTFSSNINVYNSDPTATTPNLYLRSSKTEISSQGNTSGDQNLTFLDKNNTNYAYVKGAIQSNGSVVKIRAIAKDSSDNSVVNELQLLANTNGNKAIFPLYSNEVDLGVSNYKWKSFNGVEPSSLSLPSDRSARIDISSYITNLGSGDNNVYAVHANGYIWLHFTSINSALCYSQTSGGLTNYAQTFVRYQGDGQLYAFFPVRKNDTFIVQIYTSSTAVVQNAYFIPCQGNV